MNSRRTTVTSLALLLAMLCIGPLSVGPAAAAGVPGQWTDDWPITLPSATNALSPQVAAGLGGSAVAVWLEGDVSDYHVWANEYTPATGWGVAHPLEGLSSGNSQGLHLAADDGGNATAAWLRMDGGAPDVIAIRFVPGLGWGSPTAIETNPSAAYAVKVAAGGCGDAFAVWEQADSQNISIWANRYAAQGGWGTPELLETIDIGYGQNPKVDADKACNAVAVWNQLTSTGRWAYANYYAAGSGWGGAGPLDSTLGSIGDPEVAMDDDGNAYAVWTYTDWVNSSALASRYVPGAGWGAPSPIDGDNRSSEGGLTVAAGQGGRAVALWSASGGGPSNVWASEFTKVGGWQTPQRVELNDSASSLRPYAAFAGDGSVWAVWSQSNGTAYHVWFARLDPIAGWLAAGRLDQGATGETSNVQVAGDADGSVFAVWTHADPVALTVWSAHFVEDRPPVLSLATPLEGSAVNLSWVWVTGATEPGARVTVQGLEATIARDGAFSFLFTAMAPGDNFIQVVAWDASGNRATATVSVTFEDPVAAVERDLATAQAALVDTAAQLEVARAELDMAKAALVDAQAHLAEVQEAANATQAQLDAAQAQFDSAQGDLAAAQASVALLSVSQASLQEQLTAASARANQSASDAAAAQQAAQQAQATTAAQNTSLQASRDAATAAQAAASNAFLIGTLGVLLGAGGLGLGAMGMVRGRRGAGGGGSAGAGRPPDGPR